MREALNGGRGRRLRNLTRVTLPQSYPVLNSCWLLELPGWAVAASGADAKPSISVQLPQPPNKRHRDSLARHPSSTSFSSIPCYAGTYVLSGPLSNHCSDGRQ